ncbi:MAG: hypothetical protein JXA49_07080 [Actinobacteria bacterium]|nr:hypothetical protein [Actinomycetota bacterium]
MFTNKWKLPVLIIGILSIVALLVTGCGKNDITALAPNGTTSEDGVERNLDNGKDVSRVEGVEARCKAEEEAVEEAICYAQDSNAGSEFEVTSINIADDWAGVSIQEIGVPVEEAVAFVVFLRIESDGKWLVKKAGTSITPEDLPEAPSQIFK